MFLLCLFLCESGHSKGHDQHYIVLHDSMLEIMRRYDKAIEELLPGRKYFFPSIRNSHFNRGWVTKNFSLLWRKANTSHATAYEFRHHYAVANISQWAGDKSVEETAAVIENRVQLYMDENR